MSSVQSDTVRHPRIGAGMHPARRRDLAILLRIGRLDMLALPRVVDRRLAAIRAAGMIALADETDARRRLRRARNPSSIVTWTMKAERFAALGEALAAADDSF